MMASSTKLAAAARLSLGYLRVAERLAERFHMDEDFLKALNPDAALEEGGSIWVAAPGDRLEAEVARIEIRKSERRAVAIDADGRMVTKYPVGHCQSKILEAGTGPI